MRGAVSKEQVMARNSAHNGRWRELKTPLEEDALDRRGVDVRLRFAQGPDDHDSVRGDLRLSHAAWPPGSLLQTALVPWVEAFRPQKERGPGNAEMPACQADVPAVRGSESKPPEALHRIAAKLKRMGAGDQPFDPMEREFLSHIFCVCTYIV